MLHFANNEEINPTLTTAKRFEAKLGILLTSLNTNSAYLLQPARSLSIDEIMVKFYGRSVLRQYIKALDLAAYLRSRRTSMVGTSALTQQPSDLQYLVTNMHPLTWVYIWFMCQAKFKYRPKIGPTEQLQATEPVCILVWMDKKYRTADKQVIFITNCIPAIPTSPSKQFHQKNIRDAKNSTQDSTYQARQYSRLIITAWEEWINMTAS